MSHRIPNPAFRRSRRRPDEPPPSRMPFVDNTCKHRGRPLPLPGKLRAILKDLQNANDPPDKPGPLIRGLGKLDRVAVAKRHDGWIVADCVRLLEGHGVIAWLSIYTGDEAVEVARCDMERARTILAQHRWLLSIGGALFGVAVGTRWALERWAWWKHDKQQSEEQTPDS